MKDIVIARVQTINFDFLAVGRTEKEVKQALLDAWAVHVTQYGAIPDLMRDLINDGEVNISHVRTGMVLRDGEVLVSR